MNQENTLDDVRIETYLDRAGEWRWRCISGHDVIADSGQGYSDKQESLRPLLRLLGGQIERGQDGDRIVAARIQNARMVSVTIPIRAGVE